MRSRRGGATMPATLCTTTDTPDMPEWAPDLRRGSCTTPRDVPEEPPTGACPTHTPARTVGHTPPPTDGDTVTTPPTTPPTNRPFRFGVVTTHAPTGTAPDNAALGQALDPAAVRVSRLTQSLDI